MGQQAPLDQQVLPDCKVLLDQLAPLGQRGLLDLLDLPDQLVHRVLLDLQDRPDQLAQLGRQVQLGQQAQRQRLLVQPALLVRKAVHQVCSSIWQTLEPHRAIRVTAIFFGKTPHRLTQHMSTSAI